MPNDKPSLPVTPVMAIAYAVSAALKEAVTSGDISEAAAVRLEKRSDEFIQGLFSGKVLQVKPDGLYELTDRSPELRAKYPLPGDDGALEIGDY